MKNTQRTTLLPQSPQRRSLIRAFTLIELMLAVGVIIALTVMTLPAFRAIQEGNREAGGVNAVSASLNSARSLAVRRGHDVAVMFLFDTKRQVCSMQLIEEVHITPDAGDGFGESVIFIPIKGIAPIELPQGAAVYGYGYGATRISNAKTSNPWNWYTELGQYYEESNNKLLEGRDPWLFPRTDVRLFSQTYEDAQSDNSIPFTESFIVRFDPNGVIVSGTEELAAGPSSNANQAYLELSHLHADNIPTWEDDWLQWTPRMLNRGNDQYELIPEAQLRSVPFLAVVDLYKVAADTGIRAPWLALGEKHEFASTNNPNNVDSDGDDLEDHLEIDRWINENATVLTFNRYTGNIMKEYRR